MLSSCGVEQNRKSTPIILLGILIISCTVEWTLWALDTFGKVPRFRYNMQIYPRILKRALLAVLRQDLGGMMAAKISDIKHTWPKTGFRRNDLSVALGVLIEESLIHVSQRRGVAWLELTQAGHEECLRLEVNGMQSFTDWLVLRRIKRRQREASSSNRTVRERRRG